MVGVVLKNLIPKVLQRQGVVLAEEDLEKWVNALRTSTLVRVVPNDTSYDGAYSLYPETMSYFEAIPEQTASFIRAFSNENPDLSIESIDFLAFLSTLTSLIRGSGFYVVVSRSTITKYSRNGGKIVVVGSMATDIPDTVTYDYVIAEAQQRLRRARDMSSICSEVLLTAVVSVGQDGGEWDLVASQYLFVWQPLADKMVMLKQTLDDGVWSPLVELSEVDVLDRFKPWKILVKPSN